MKRREFLGTLIGTSAAFFFSPPETFAGLATLPLNVYHVSCGQVAFRLRTTFEAYRDGVVINSAIMSYDDGRIVHDDDGTGTTGTIITCQSCRKMVGELLTLNGRAVAGDSGFD